MIMIIIIIVPVIGLGGVQFREQVGDLFKIRQTCSILGQLQAVIITH